MKIAIGAYGPKGLVEKLKECKWTPCAPSGENFDGIDLFGYCLTRPEDELVLPVAVVVKEAGEIFMVAGYGFPAIFSLAINCQKEPRMAALADSPLELAGCRLNLEPGKDLVSYDILILDADGLADYENRMGAGKLLQ